ncbi:hypothetical protein C5E08_08715 [Rathayibacter iranicus]|uniref:Secreted protein n=2 Tax=Rathayibacter iranicus TaxID=59737 RepID=A0AAD1AD45_9MICO|nr:hypothetical protein C7V51_08755 [Rathayibacter iranicus]PPI47107.1 hypothetical protein C5E09_07785 [Rathayibacter iranicus]PPI60107.1 hypothetical protein C5E08_08715 [Rathayibacter iranicus]PPI71671.1 hypothetical protein C5E01_07750 [Rathayibacter iranicus]
MMKCLFRATLAVTLAIPVMVTGATSASADDRPTVTQLLELCNKGTPDSCVFHPRRVEIFDSPPQLAGSSTNCSPYNATRVIRYDALSGTTNTWGVEVNARTKLGEAFEVGVSATVQHQWLWTDTRGDEIRQDIGPRGAVNIWAAKQSTRVAGTWEIHFGSRYFGHYIWYVDGSVTGQVVGQGWEFRTEQVPADC